MVDPRTTAQEAIAGFLHSGQIVVSWLVVIEVAGQDGNRLLTCVPGGGHDGTLEPTPWTQLGMLQAATGPVLARLNASTAWGSVDPVDEEDE